MGITGSIIFSITISLTLSYAIWAWARIQKYRIDLRQQELEFARELHAKNMPRVGSVGTMAMRGDIQ